ncbi:GIY-YIG nuclease family protein [Micromonospora sp. NPDC053740]|uniref:GIY-YIG nuclease family protein n=1 Tax=Micromonospora sp. NPDC053740 TaxID=3155173 RepID=UPI0034420F89
MKPLTYLYWLWDREGQLIYVGITDDVERRMRDHAKDKFWWGDVKRTTKMAFQTRHEAEWAEWAVIATSRPVYNRALSPPPMPRPAEVDGVAPAPTYDPPSQPTPVTPPAGGELDRMEIDLATGRLRQHPRDRVREIVKAAHISGMGPGKVFKKLQTEGYPTTFQTVNGWLKADAAAGILIQPGGSRTPYFPGPRLGYPYPARVS